MAPELSGLKGDVSCRSMQYLLQKALKAMLKMGGPLSHLIYMTTPKVANHLFSCLTTLSVSLSHPMLANMGRPEKWSIRSRYF